MAAHNKLLGSLVDRHPAGSRACPRSKNTIKIQEGSGLSKEEIDRMISDAEAHADEGP